MHCTTHGFVPRLPITGNEKWLHTCACCIAILTWLADVHVPIMITDLNLSKLELEIGCVVLQIGIDGSLEKPKLGAF